MQRRVLLGMVLCLALVPTLLSQDAVPNEILRRTLFIRFGNNGGTAFKIDHQEKVYLVTARHVIDGVPGEKATIQVMNPNGTWDDFHTIRTLYPPSKDADIAVFETDEKLAQPYEVGTAGSVTFGQQIWFLGYPLTGLGTHFTDAIIPFIKRGTMSAIDATNPDATVLYIDGFNNPGFSGGPILFWDFNSHTYQIIGVVKGYAFENAKTMINDKPVDTPILVNSGILVGYSIHHAIQAIEKENSPR